MKEAAVVLEAMDIHKSFSSGREMRTILDGVSLTLRAGEWLAVTGPSGVGKTTLLHVLAGILPPDSGSVRWAGADYYAMPEPERDTLRASWAGLVFQFHHLLPDLTVRENIRLALELAARGPAGRDAAGESRVDDFLSRLALSDLASSRIEKLSGGERQRIAVARALVHRPNVLFADEPTGNLDERSAAAVLDLFDAACREYGASVVLSTHNPAAAARAARRLELRSGRLS